MKSGPADTAAALCSPQRLRRLTPLPRRWLTDALQEVSLDSGISEEFIGLIILPIAGNAVEHLTAIYVAMRNKMDLAIAVALGSSIQVSMFIIPIIVRPRPVVLLRGRGPALLGAAHVLQPATHPAVPCPGARGLGVRQGPLPGL